MDDQLRSWAQSVCECCPEVTLEDAMKDVKMTRSVAITINRIFDGQVQLN